MQERYWQNWDQGEAAKRIDNYWVESEDPWRETLVADVKNYFEPGMSILEIGCGSGLIAQKMIQHGVVDYGSYIGGDVSKNMLALARNRHPGGVFVEADIFNLQFADKSQPNVINVHVLQHLPHYRDALKELIRITAERLYVVCWFNEKLTDDIQFSPPSNNWDGQAFHNNTYSLAGFLGNILCESGRGISELRVYNFGGSNYSIFMEFKN